MANNSTIKGSRSNKKHDIDNNNIQITIDNSSILITF